MTMALLIGTLLIAFWSGLVLTAVATRVPATMTTGVGAFLLALGVFRTFTDVLG